MASVPSWSVSTDPTALLHKHLAAALGDAQYWDETISPTQIRQDLQTSDPSNPSSTPVLLKAMKWLLANISKGRDVSDFYVDVVKLVACKNPELRKMVISFMIQYADHNAQTRQASLLSINSFQRGLNDAEPLIRALALRAFTSVQLADILPIQVLAVTKLSKNDPSPYVRKCAVIAMAKLGPRITEKDQFELLLELVVHVLNHDRATMVLSSAVIAYYELTHAETKYLHLLHGSFRKLCVLLTDMDEWGQVITISVLMRYCRMFFQAPPSPGSAELIDSSRRVVRTTATQQTPVATASPATTLPSTVAAAETMPNKHHATPRKVVKRRVVKKAFYSDEEDESTEEEQVIETLVSQAAAATDDAVDKEELELDEDHRFLLRSATPLLKSRNAGVVVAVCNLQFYCGVSTVKIRKNMGKALSRIHRDRHFEIQNVVLLSIRTLARLCPSAFAQFLPDFFCNFQDPVFSKITKLDILVSLALDPPSIKIVLEELRTYTFQYPQDLDDLEFVCASIRAVGRVAEMAKVCYERKHRKAEATTILLNCVFGITTLSYACDHEIVVGETVIVIQRLLQMLKAGDETFDDPNQVRQRALRRILLLLVHTLSCLGEDTDESETVDERDDDSDDEDGDLAQVALVLPPAANAAAISIIGECLAHNDDFVPNSGEVWLELARLLVRCFLEMEICEKEQAIHFASKMRLVGNDKEAELCERLLALGRLDTNIDVRDRARFESGVVNASVGLKYDREGMEGVTPSTSIDARQILFSSKKPAPTYLPLEDDESGFRFGTLSSLVGHRVHNAYLPLPPWASENSPSSLRDPPEDQSAYERNNNVNTGGGFYKSSEDDESDSEEDSDDDSEEEDDSESFSDTETDDSEDDAVREGNLLPVQHQSSTRPPVENGSEESSSDDDDEEEDDDDDLAQELLLGTGNLIPLGGDTKPALAPRKNSQGPSSVVDDFKGMVLEPVTPPVSSKELEAGAWTQLVRSEHTTGLSVEIRYLRGVSKSQQAQLMGLVSDKPTVVCVQFRFENRRDNVPFRRIRILQRSSSASGSTIGPSKVVVPNEINLLEPNKTIECMVGIDFSSASDRDGSLHAKLEIKFGSGGVPVNIKPSIGEVLLPCNRSVAEFDSATSRMHGFNRVETKCSLVDSEDLEARIVSRIALSRVGKCQDGNLRLVGALPASSDPVYVLVKHGEGKIIVYCDHALVVNSVMNTLKRAVSNTT